MATGPITRLSDAIVPEIFTPYSQLLTMEKSAFVSSGVVSRDGFIDSLLTGAGSTFHIPSFNDLDNDDARISTDSIPFKYSGGVNDPDPKKITTVEELAVRLNRNLSWGASSLVQDLAGADPMQAIANRASEYWARQLNKLIITVIQGIFADNAAAPTGTDKHIANDMTLDIKGNAFAAGTTNISGGAVIDALGLLGDASEELQIMVVHPIVMNNLRKQNLIAFIPPAEGRVGFNSYLGRRIIETDSMPTSDKKIFETWFFAPGSLRMGMKTVENATEVERLAGAGNGGGADVLYNRVCWCIHPTGYRYIGAANPPGGPDNATLAAAASWSRVYPERKQVKIARLITRES